MNLYVGLSFILLSKKFLANNLFGLSYNLSHHISFLKHIFKLYLLVFCFQFFPSSNLLSVLCCTSFVYVYLFIFEIRGVLSDDYEMADVTEVLCELELTIRRVKVSTTPDGTVMDLFLITDTRFLFFPISSSKRMSFLSSIFNFFSLV